MSYCRVFRAFFLAPLIGVAPFPKFPTGIAYGKWVALRDGPMWYIELGYMLEYHAELECALRARYATKQLADYMDGTLHQRGGRGTELTFRSNLGVVPEFIQDAIRNALLDAQKHLRRTGP